MNFALYRFMCEYSRWKEQTEYMRWLHSLGNFTGDSQNEEMK